MSFEFYGNFMILNGKANFSICARCGAAIKNTYEYRGKIYGSECINKATGKPINEWIVKNGIIDESATLKRDIHVTEKQNKIDELAKQNYINTQIKSARCASDNKWLIDVLVTGYGPFCTSMADELKSSYLTEFSGKQLNIMADIYGKYFGKRNSKKYNKAIDEFWQNIDNIQPQEEI